MLAKACMRGRITSAKVLALLFWCCPGAGGLHKCTFLGGVQFVSALGSLLQSWSLAVWFPGHSLSWDYSSTGTGLCTSL